MALHHHDSLCQGVHFVIPFENIQRKMVPEDRVSPNVHHLRLVYRLRVYNHLPMQACCFCLGQNHQGWEVHQYVGLLSVVDDPQYCYRCRDAHQPLTDHMELATVKSPKDWLDGCLPDWQYVSITVYLSSPQKSNRSLTFSP